MISFSFNDKIRVEVMAYLDVEFKKIDYVGETGDCNFSMDMMLKLTQEVSLGLKNLNML